ncbi:MAG: hypothetical protein U5L96_16390 [Owenweeksia sp.]|nr:hypothetical protein [Owenweeksia sp.]
MEIYDHLPTGSGEVMLASYADGFGDLKGQLDVPYNLKKVYVVMTTPDGSSSMAVVPVLG